MTNGQESVSAKPSKRVHLSIATFDDRGVEPYRFSGFVAPGYTQVPNELFDELMNIVTDIELRVLLYIVRRTFGFSKESDAISLGQMVGGIKTRDGVVLDHGTGLSRPSVVKAIRGLEEKQILLAERTRAENGSQAVTSYRLNVIRGVVNGVNQGSKPGLLGVVNGVNQGVVNRVYPQKKVEQQKVGNTTPYPLKGEHAPSSQEEGPAPSAEKKEAQPESAAAEQKLPPPTPSSPPLLDDRSPLDLQSRARLKRSAATNGWSEWPSDLEKLQNGLRTRWSALPVTRWSEKDLELVAQFVAPDEADRFKKQTDAYMASDEVARGIVYGLRRWLSEAWKVWEPSPVAQRGVSAAYVTPAQEIAMLSKMTGRNMRAG